MADLQSGAENTEHSAGIMSVLTEKMHLQEDEHLKVLIQGLNAATEAWAPQGGWGWPAVMQNQLVPCPLTPDTRDT